MLKISGSFLRKNSVIYLFAIISCILWGSAYPCIKIGYGLLSIAPGDAASQILFAGMRFFLAGVLTVLIFSIINKRFLLPRKDSWGNISKLGAVQTVLQYLFFYIGLANTTAAKSSIIGGAYPFIALLFACFLFHQEKFTRIKLFGSLLGFAGIVLINLDFAGMQGGMSLFGEGFILISCAASAMSAPMTKIYSDKEDPIILSGYQFILGGAAMIVIGLLMGGKADLSSSAAVAILFYLALLSAVAYALWSLLLKYNPVSKVAIFAFMIPVFGVFLSALMLAESAQAMNLQSLLSLVMVSAGIILINKFHTSKVHK